MRILVVGSGGREHAIIHKLNQSNTVFATGQNAGISQTIGQANCFDIDPTNPLEVVKLSQDLAVDLVVIGPEAPLVAGVADELIAAGIKVFGPTKAAAQIEASKDFAKSLMHKLHIPTANSITCKNLVELETALNELGSPFVVKDDGLAAGKGVVVTEVKAEALAHGAACFELNHQVVVEEFLAGEEVSVLCISDGSTIYPLIAAQDYKRIYDQDLGPNTGGMGAYAPVAWFDQAMQQQVVTQIAQPIIAELDRIGHKFVGVLYCGLINTAAGLKVIEFNARFGDPETQVVLALLESDLAQLLHAAAAGRLAQLPAPEFKSAAAVCVVMAAAGYPASATLGEAVEINTVSSPDLVVLHAGTKLANGTVKTAGGRVLSVVASADSINNARELAYAGVAAIKFAGSQYRSDIGLGKGSK